METNMTSKKTDLEYVRAWLDALGNPTTERERSKALRDMIRVVLAGYDARIVTGDFSAAESDHIDAQYR
jgi:hypothetical protein